MNDPVASPCVRICCLDDDNICIGCGRSLDEIRDWSGMSEQDKQSAINRAADRRALRNRRFSRAYVREMDGK